VVLSQFALPNTSRFLLVRALFLSFRGPVPRLCPRGCKKTLRETREEQQEKRKGMRVQNEILPEIKGTTHEIKY
jgi:hypothetical protein